MKVLIFGATGMVGQGMLRECLRAADVDLVQTVGRTRSGQLDARLHEIIQADLMDYRGIESSLAGFDACFFCLGVSSAGMKEADYARLTYDLTLAAAETLARLNPQMTFIYVSGAGTDSSEQGRSMWARVKGKTENALLRLPFKAVYLFRPGLIQATNGEVSKTRSYRIIYALLKPVVSMLRALFPNHVLTTEDIGQTMLALVRRGAPKAVFEIADILAIRRSASGSTLDLSAGH